MKWVCIHVQRKKLRVHAVPRRVREAQKRVEAAFKEVEAQRAMTLGRNEGIL